MATERQLKNRAWLGEHPFLLAVIGGVLFGLIGAGIGAAKWGGGGALALGVLGVIAGALCGIATSMDYRDAPDDATWLPGKWRSPIYVLGIVLMGVLIFAIRLG